MKLSVISLLSLPILLFVIILTTTQATDPNAISLDRVTLLLPSPTCSNYHTPVTHALNARGGSGCFRWGTAHTHLISVIPSTHPAHQCTVRTKSGISVRGTTQAIVTVLPNEHGIVPPPQTTEKAGSSVSSPKSVRQNAVVWVEDASEGARAVCEVYLDTIQSIFIKTSTKRINLGEKNVFSIQAYDEHQDTFSSLEGLNFEWFFLTDAANNNSNFLPVGPGVAKMTQKIIARPTSFLDANVNISPVRTEMAKKDIGTDLLLISGANSGRTKFKASYTCKGVIPAPPVTTTVDIVVSEPLDVLPPILKMCPRSEFSFYLQSRYSKSSSGEILASSSNPTLISLPQPHLVWKSDNTALSVIDDKLAKVRANSPGIAKVTVVDTVLQETSASSTVVVAEPVSAKVLLYYYNDVEGYYGTNTGVVNSLPSADNAHKAYIHSYSNAHHGQSTMTTIPLEVPYDTYPGMVKIGQIYGQSGQSIVQSGKKNQTVIAMENQYRASLPLTGNVLIDEVDAFLATDFKNTPESGEIAKKRAQLQLQPTCDGKYHLSPAFPYMARLLILDSTTKPIDICQGISVKIVYTSTPKPQNDQIDILVDNYGFFALTTPKYDATVYKNEPITGVITVTIDSFVHNIPFQIDPPLHVRTDSDQFVATSALPHGNKQPLNTMKTLLFPAQSSQCPIAFSPVGGSGKFFWSNTGLKTGPNTQHSGQRGKALGDVDFLTINADTMKQLSVSPTQYTGGTTFSLLDRCNPLARASFKVETALIGDLCIAPHSNELFLPATLSPPALPSPSPNQSQSTPAAQKSTEATVYFHISDSTGRKFTDSRCIQVQTQFKPAPIGQFSPLPSSNNPQLTLPAGQVGKQALSNAVYQQHCTPTTDEHNKLAKPQPQSYLPTLYNDQEAQNRQQHVAPCYTTSFHPQTAGFITLTASLTDPLYKSTQSSTTFAIYNNPHISPLTTTSPKTTSYNTIHAIFGSPIPFRVHNGVFPFPHVSTQTAMCGTDKLNAQQVAKNQAGALPTSSFSAPSGLQITTTPTHFGMDVFPVFNLTCINQQQQKPNEIASHDITFFASNSPTLSNQYPHATSTVAQVKCYEPVCPVNRHVKVVLGDTINVEFKPHPLQTAFKYATVDQGIASIVQDNAKPSQNVIKIKGEQVGMTIVIVDVIFGNEIQPHMRSFVVVQVETADVRIVGNEYLVAGESGSYTLHSSSKSSSFDLQYMSVIWSMMNINGDANLMLEPTFSSDELETIPSNHNHNHNRNHNHQSTTSTAHSITPQPLVTKLNVNGLSSRLLTTDAVQPGKYQLIASFSTTYPSLSPSTKQFLRSELAVSQNVQLCSQSLQQYLTNFLSLGITQDEASVPYQVVQTRSFDITIASKLRLLSPNTLRIPFGTTYPILTSWSHAKGQGKVDIKSYNPTLQVSTTGLITAPKEPLSALLHISTPNQSQATDLAMTVHVSKPHSIDLTPITATLRAEDPSVAVQSLLYNNKHTNPQTSKNGLYSLYNSPLCPLGGKTKEQQYSLVLRDGAGFTFSTYALADAKGAKATKIHIFVDKPELLRVTPISINPSFHIFFNHKPLTLSSLPQQTDSLLGVSFAAISTLEQLQEVTISFQVEYDLWNDVSADKTLQPFYLRLTVGSKDLCSSSSLPISKTNQTRGNQLVTTRRDYTRGLRLTMHLSEDFLSSHQQKPTTQSIFGSHSASTTLSTQDSQDLLHKIHKSLYSLLITATNDAVKQHSLMIFDADSKLTHATIVFVLPTIHLYIKHVDLALGIVLADAFFIPQCMVDARDHTSSQLHPHQWQDCELSRISRTPDPATPQLLPSHAYAIELAQYFNQIESSIFDHIEQRQLPVQPLGNKNPNSTINQYNPWVKHILSNTGESAIPQDNAIFAQHKPIYIDLFDATPIKQLLLGNQIYRAGNPSTFPQTITVSIHSSPIITTLQSSPAAPKVLVASEINIDPNQPLSNIGVNSIATQQVVQVPQEQDELLQYRYTIKMIPDLTESYLNQRKQLTKPVPTNVNPVIQHLYPFYSPYTHLSTQITQSDYILSCIATYSHHTIPALTQQLLSHAEQLPALQQSQQHVNIPPHILKTIPIDTTFFPTVFYSQSQPFSTASNTFMLPTQPHSTIRGTCHNLIAGLTTSFATPNPSPQQSLWAISQHYILVLSQRIEQHYNTPIPVYNELPQQHQPIAGQAKVQYETDQQRPILKHAQTYAPAEPESSSAFSTILFASVVALIAGVLIVWSNASKQVVPTPPPPPAAPAPQVASPHPSVPRQTHPQTPHTKLYYSYGEN